MGIAYTISSELVPSEQFGKFVELVSPLLAGEPRKMAAFNRRWGMSEEDYFCYLVLCKLWEAAMKDWLNMDVANRVLFTFDAADFARYLQDMDCPIDAQTLLESLIRADLIVNMKSGRYALGNLYSFFKPEYRGR